MTNPEPVAYRYPDFIARFGVSRSTADREIKAGRLKAIKRGKSVIITAAAAKAWLEGLPAAA
jgi:hypothetical protein